MAFTPLKIVLFALAVFNLILISILVSLGKNRLAVALAVLEAVIVATTFGLD